MDAKKVIKKWITLWEDNRNDPSKLKYVWETSRHVRKEDYKLGFGYSKYVRNQCYIGVKNAKSASDRRKFLGLYRDALVLDAQTDFESFCLYIEIDREAKARFYQPRQEQLQHIATRLTDLYDGVIELLSISMPPGVGKSTLGLFFLAWVMLRDPNAPNLATGHSSKLVKSFYKGVMELFQDPEYRTYDPFPSSRLIQTSAEDLSVDLLMSKRYPTLTCRSIEGSLTGVTRAENILYADDLVSGIEVALNRDRLDTLWFRYSNDLRNRKKQFAKELHIATRWSVHDVIGRLERMYEGDPKADFISVPALDENEQSNFDYPHGVGFDTQYFLAMRDVMDEVGWKALFMNEPIEREGVVYHISDLNRYFDLPDREPDAVVAGCDPAQGGGDFTCMPIAYIYGKEVYIEDVVYNDGLPEVTKPSMISKIKQHKVKSIRFESNNAGGEIASSIQESLDEINYKIHITKNFSTTNKITRIIMASDPVKKSFYFKDDSRIKNKIEYRRFLDALTSYSHVGKNKHDDAPDGITILQKHIDNMSGNQVEIFKRPF